MEKTVERGGGGEDFCAGQQQQPLQTMYVQVEQRPVVNSSGGGEPTSVIKANHGGGRPHSPAAGTASGRYVVTVKLECPDSQVITQAWTLTASAGSLKERLSRMVELPVGILHLIHGGRQVQDHVRLNSIFCFFFVFFSKFISFLFSGIR